MRKKNILKFVLFLCITICAVFASGVYAGAVNTAVPAPNAVQPDAVTIEELNIISNYAVLEGQTLQMQVEEFDEFVLFGSVEWSSSKPDVISCTKNGEIKGLKGGTATISATVGNSGRSDFTYTINPIYFYMDMVKNDELILNMDCSAVNSGYSFYFYNYDE